MVTDSSRQHHDGGARGGGRGSAELDLQDIDIDYLSEPFQFAQAQARVEIEETLP